MQPKSLFWYIAVFVSFLGYAAATAAAFVHQDPAMEDIDQKVLIQEIPATLPPESGVQSKILANIPLGPVSTEDAVMYELSKVLSENSEFLSGVPFAELKFKFIHHMPGTEQFKESYTVEFVQVYGGAEVYGTRVSVLIKNFGEANKGSLSIASASSKLVSNLGERIGETEALSLDVLRAEAAKALLLDTPGKALKEEWKIIYDHKKSEWSMVLAIILEENSDYTFFIKADGEIVGLLSNKLHQATPAPITGKVSGRGVIFDPVTTGNNLSKFPLSSLEVKLQGGTSVFTDRLGNFSFPGVTSGYLKAELKGLFADVIPIQGVPLKLSKNVGSSVPVKFDFNPSGNQEFSTSQINAYAHTTLAHDWLKFIMPSFSAIDQPLDVLVNIDNHCNAFYNFAPSIIGFYEEGGGCLNSAYDTIIYHEYGHFADDMAGGFSLTFDALSLSEGWGDLISSFISDQPLIGENFTNLFPIRTADNDYQYILPGRYMATTDPHVQGQAWSGFGWHLKEGLIRRYGTNLGKMVAHVLVLPTILQNAQDIPDAVWQTVLRDDNTGNMNNNLTPHFWEIVRSAERHSLYPFRNSNVHIETPMHTAFLGKRKPPVHGNFNYDIYGVAGTSRIAGAPPFFYYSLGYFDGPLLYGIGQNHFNEVTSSAVLETWNIANVIPGKLKLRLHTEALNPFISFGDEIDVYVDPQMTQITDQFINLGGFDVSYTDIAINQNYIAYMAGDWQQGSRIYLYDKRTGTAQEIDPPAPQSGQQLRLAMSDRFLVWTQWDQPAPSTTVSVKVYDLATGQIRSIATVPMSLTAPFWIDVEGNAVVWSAYHDPSLRQNGEIYYYDLSTNVLLNITNDPAPQARPVTDGNFIVWEDYRNGLDLYVYDINSSLTRQLTFKPGAEHNPAIYNGDVVWADNQAGRLGIFMKNVNSNIEIQLSNNSSWIPNPDISSDLIVWQESDPLAGEINDRVYSYDRRTGVTSPLTNWSDKIEAFPKVYGRNAAFMTELDTNGPMYQNHVFMIEK